MLVNEQFLHKSVLFIARAITVKFNNELMINITSVMAIGGSRRGRDHSGLTFHYGSVLGCKYMSHDTSLVSNSPLLLYR